MAHPCSAGERRLGGSVHSIALVHPPRSRYETPPPPDTPASRGHRGNAPLGPRLRAASSVGRGLYIRSITIEPSGIRSAASGVSPWAIPTGVALTRRAHCGSVRAAVSARSESTVTLSPAPQNAGGLGQQLRPLSVAVEQPHARCSCLQQRPHHGSGRTPCSQHGHPLAGRIEISLPPQGVDEPGGIGVVADQAGILT